MNAVCVEKPNPLAVIAMDKPVDNVAGKVFDQNRSYTTVSARGRRFACRCAGFASGAR